MQIFIKFPGVNNCFVVIPFHLFSTEIVTENVFSKYIFYEFEDWAYQGKDEISVEVMFSTENFREIAEEICAQKDSIAEKIAPNLLAVCNRSVSKGFIRVQFVFPDDVDAASVARAMSVLIQHTKDTINEWLKSENKSHY